MTTKVLDESPAWASTICKFMEPRPRPRSLRALDSKHGWWRLSPTRSIWQPVKLTLDHLHRAEARLSDKQWLFYSTLCWKWFTEAKTTNDHEISHLNRWRRMLLHLTCDQKAKALAYVLKYYGSELPN